MITRQEFLRDKIADLQEAFDRTEKATNWSRQQAGESRSRGREDDYWTEQYLAAKAQRDQLAAELQRATETYKRLFVRVPPPSEPPTRPPPVEPPPRVPPSTGRSVDPYALKQMLEAQPKKQAYADWGHSITWPAMRDTRYTVGQGLAILNTSGTGPGSIQAYKKPEHTLERCELDGQGKVRWGTMGYGMNGTRRHVLTRKVKEEHVFYNKGCYDLLIEECLAEEIGSQDTQQVNRAWEMVNPLDVYNPNGNGLPSKFRLNRCAMMQVGLPTGARPSYAGLSLFETQGIPWPAGKDYPSILCDVELTGNHVETKGIPNYQASGGVAYSFGGFMVHGYGHLFDIDNRTLLDWPDRSSRQYWWCQSVTILGGESHDYWHGKEHWLDIRGPSGSVIEVDGLEGEWRATVCTGPWMDLSYIFQDQQLAPYKKFEHRSKTQGKSFKFVIP